MHPHLNNRNVGSYRLQTLQPHLQLVKDAYDSTIVDHIDKATAMHPDVIICMQVNDAAPATNYKFGVNKNVKVIVFQSDGPITSPEVLDNCDWIVTDSDILKIRNPARFLSKTTHISTALEFDPSLFSPHTHPGRNLKFVLVAAQGNLHFAESVIQQLKPRFDISILSDRADADVLWNVDTYADDLNKFDVGIVPYPPYLIVEDAKSFSGYFYKDPSRPSLLQSVGLPIVVSPLPSYVSYLTHGYNGLMANTIEEWILALDALQNDSQLYNMIANFGYFLAWETHHKVVVAQQWKQVIKEICNA